jgi:hypothetical protein
VHCTCKRPVLLILASPAHPWPAEAAAAALLLLLLLPAVLPLLLLSLQLWFASVLRDATSAQAAGLLRPFKEIGAHHLEVMLREAGKEEWSR